VTCSWCEERFERFLDGLVNDAERARLLLHVDSCANCSGLLEELRVIDALLLGPRPIELPADFTSATMADVREMALPCARHAPIMASLVAYIVGAWALVVAAYLIAPDVVLTAGVNVVAASGTILAAIAGLGHAFVHFGDVASWTTVAGGVVIADGLVLVAAAVALRVIRPRIIEHLRW
jgi:Putative zinc-finger